MAFGKVRWYSTEKGYGFIAPEDGKKDLFVHYTAIEGNGFKTLDADDEVQYDVIRNEKGLAASNVRKLVS